MNLFVVVSIVLMTFGFATSAMAGSIDDADGDGIPDVIDNCTLVANGIAAGGTCSNQIDSDADGFGDICDSDFDNDGITGFSDFTILLAAIGSADPVIDLDCDGIVAFSDVTIYLGHVGKSPGPSGLNP